jgi:hypothetical protein
MPVSLYEIQKYFETPGIAVSGVNSIFSFNTESSFKNGISGYG